ncbi:MAG TPA: alpha/beta hydrolase [Tepidisphaeraceae bacterium]|nr:alpha/beta hydrolase [Tepidisphaeraceae bacterium]
MLISKLTLAVMVLCSLAGCASRTLLITTPNTNVGAETEARFNHLDPSLQTNDIPILYAADRAVVNQGILGPEYGEGRSSDLVFGSATVGLKPQMSWAELVRRSTTKGDKPATSLEMKSVVEMGRLAVPLKQMEVRDGRYQLSEGSKEELAASKAKLQQIIDERLSHTSQKDVFIFVHGFHNTFDDAAFRLAQTWHFAGRPGVAIVYSWPAGHPGLLGYAYDRESGEFTIFHLKLFLQAVAAIPSVQRIHLIAHSRGTDVAVTALRELNLVYKARGLDTQKELKLENLVLAAPDLDFDVFEQRFGLEDLHMAAKRTTIYMRRNDIALSLSRWLFNSHERMGSLLVDDIEPGARRKLAELGRVDLIQCDVTGFSTSHDYAFAHPAVTSDMILLLRDGKLPGAANGRPLKVIAPDIWGIDNDYPKSPPTTQRY